MASTPPRGSTKGHPGSPTKTNNQHEAWKVLFQDSPTQGRKRSTSGSSSVNSSDDGFDSDHSEELDPEIGFDAFATASRRARQQSASSQTVIPSESEHSSPATSNDALQTIAASDDAERWANVERFWSKVVDEAMFKPKQGPIDLSDKYITEILPSIADLSRYVAIPPPRYDKEEVLRIDDLPQVALSKTGGLVRHESYLAPFSSHRYNDAETIGASTFDRSQSAYQPSMRTNSFARTDSAMSNFSNRSGFSNSPRYQDPRDKQATLSIFLAQNALTKLPSALFQLSNLRVLSLRRNNLERLPPAIGELHNLTELNIANNQLRYLPASILRLRLELFTHFPNPWVKPPTDARLTVRPILGIKAKRGRHKALHRLAKVNETTPVRGKESDEEARAVPPPITRPGHGNARLGATRQRAFDRTRSEAQVQGYLARGIDRIGLSSNGTIEESDDQDELTEESASVNAAKSSDAALTEEQRARILEAAFDADSDDGSSQAPSAAEANWLKGKVEGRSRCLGAKELADVPTLQELCVRRLLSPYDTAEGKAQGLVSPFLSPSVSSVSRRRGSRGSSRLNTPQWGPKSSFNTFSGRSVSFSSSKGSESGGQGRRVPTLLEAYENGTLQSLSGELGRGLVPLLEASRRSATGDWGTRARMRRTTSSKKNPFVRTQSGIGNFSIKAAAGSGAESSAEAEEDFDIFGSVETTGSLDRGDDACDNPWFSRCPNPKHLHEHNVDPYDIQSSRSTFVLHRSRGLGSSSSVSSLGTMLGGGGGALHLHEPAASSADSTGRLSPFSQASSASTVGAYGSGSASSLQPQALQNHEPTLNRACFERGPSFSRSNSSSSSIISRGPHFGGGMGSAGAPFGRAQSGGLVRGFSTSSALSASDLHSTSFAGGKRDDTPLAGRDWPLEETEYRQAPVFWKHAEQRLEWVSHIAGVGVGKLEKVQADLEEDQEVASTEVGSRARELIPIMWRGCSRGCLEFLV